MEAVMALERFATPATRLALTDIIENENCFYKVRCDAAYCLAKVDFLFMSINFTFFRRMF
jgi:transcription initiation factor TFIID subunit 2